MIFVFLILLALPFAIWWVLGGRRTLPLVVVQILCGIALGPAVFGPFAPNFHAAIFSPDIIKGLNATALLAVMIFVFFAGVELNAHWLGMMIFILATGLRTSWEMGGLAIVGAAALLLLAAAGGKLAGVAIAGQILNWPKGDAQGIGWLLQTKALILIIFSNVLLDKGLISGATFTALLLMAVASTVLTMPIVNRWLSAR